MTDREALPTSPLERQLISILANNREDSHATQRQRSVHLKEACRIVETKFGLQKLANLGMKHVSAVVAAWKEAHAGKRVLENKFADLRWLCQKIGKANLMPKSNQDLGVEPGARHTRAGKIISDARWEEIMNVVQHPVVRAQLLLARHFGMRFEESALFRPHVQIDGNRVWINRGSKGGRPRFVLIRTQEQREALAAALAVAKSGRGLIPEEERTFKTWADKVYAMLRSVGIGRKTDTTFHDARRTYAVERAMDLVKRGCRTVDEAITVVSRELGHNRAELMAWYLSAAQMAALEALPPATGTKEAA